MRKGIYICVLSAIVWTMNTSFDDPTSTRSGMVAFLYDYLELKYQDVEFNDFIYVAAKRQRLYHIRDNQVHKRYEVSTSKFGIGGEEKSHKTPLGLHVIASKYGDNVPLGGILEARSFKGRVAEIITEPISVDTDDVTTRVMWLRGLEEGINKGDGFDSRKRCIYIHGTPEEGLIGTPASHGCIRMRNTEVQQLYDEVRPGTYVVILNN